MLTIRSEAIRAHVKFVADDLLEGRATGTRGYLLAARYVAAQFETMGLEPAGAKGTFFQPIRFRNTVIKPEGTSLKLISGGKEETLAYGEDYFALRNPSERTFSLNGAVVYAGYGIDAPEFGIDDYKGLDVRGKIVALRSGALAGLPPAQRAPLGHPETKRDTATAHGAIGLISIWDAESEKDFSPFSRRLAQSILPGMRWLDEDGFPSGRRHEIRHLAVLSESGTRKLLGSSRKPGLLDASIAIRTTAIIRR